MLRRLARRWLPRRTVRLRLTLLYGGVFLVSGAALLVVTYLLVAHAVRGPFQAFQPAPGNAPAPAGAGLLTGAAEMLPRQMQEAVEKQQDAMLHQLLVQSGIALGLMAAASVALGWLVAGRILRRLRTITTTARDISATNLHRRLALDGPVDELKELGDTIDNLLARLEGSFEAQRRFVANASHELLTPLARQRALGQVALSDPDAPAAELRRAHERILAAGEQQERLIDALLTLARGQTGIAVRRPFDLGELAREVTDARPDAGVTIRTSAGPAVASGHRPLAERLVSNLVGNAVRHNVPGGWVEVLTRTFDGRAVLVVSNTGPEVPADAIGDIFQPFHRLGATRTGEGLGLGLSIVEAVARAHDATVTAVPRPGGGLTVTVAFPAAAAGADNRGHEVSLRVG
ncbi:HAMP domain-containing histidine kinase [Amycolatopsis thermalba]|uniref:histidine kinase n=1 Tax=Amycolatopsis thermalba TaxID=944492 RepID=A0ABY4P0H7_9PSEU|nr:MULTISPECIES: HAMP domain-containing sensor histidine kinase [Amycolatopsis]UQS25827.1 HAMP domain-containing histidine kinase [Amycolatopsis thermalba]